MSPSDLAHFFVYGTLKRGQFREKSWPRRPQSVHSAWVFGSLYDLGAYPAMTGGETPIMGELWSFALEDEAEVTRVLDQIECTNQPGEPNLYDRIQLPVQVFGTSVTVNANTYVYSDTTSLRQLALIPPTLREPTSGRFFSVWEFDYRSE